MGCPVAVGVGEERCESVTAHLLRGTHLLKEGHIGHEGDTACLGRPHVFGDRGGPMCVGPFRECPVCLVTI